jgi:hypothetical protein
MTRKATKSDDQAQPVIAVKGFDKNLQCRGFQFELEKTYTHEGNVEKCASGFHACENPLDVFGYYSPVTSRFALVELSGELSREESGDSKIAAGSITIKGELKIPTLVDMGVKWILSKTTDTKVESNTGDQSAATNTGYQSVATNTGDRSVATNTGDRSAATNTGYRSAATNTGDRSVATNTGDRSVATNTGDQSAATNTGDLSVATNTGDQSAATNTGYRSAATNTGDRSVATNTGDQSVSTNTGDQSVATNTGDQSAATNTGYGSVASVSCTGAVAMSIGYRSSSSAGVGGAIVCVYLDDDFNLIHIRASKVGENGIEPGIAYTLDADGNFAQEAQS